MNLLAAFMQEPVRGSTVVQAVLTGLAIVFVFSVWASGFTARKINNVSGATYAKAFAATALKNLFGSFVFFVMAGYLDVDYRIALAVVAVVVPIVVYKIVFACPRYVEAIMIWFPTLLVEAIVSWGVLLAGIVSLNQITQGG